MATKTYFQPRGERVHTKTEIEPYEPKETKVLTQKKKVVDNIILPYLEEENDKTSEYINSCKASDFALENIIAIGAESKLKPCMLKVPSLILDTELNDKLIAQMEEEDLKEYIQSQTTTQTNKKTEE